MPAAATYSPPAVSAGETTNHSGWLNGTSPWELNANLDCFVQCLRLKRLHNSCPVFALRRTVDRLERCRAFFGPVPDERYGQRTISRSSITHGGSLMVTTHTSVLRSREAIAEGTMAFHFDRPAGFAFKAGQYMIVTLSDPPETDAEGNRRTFTISSAPSDPDLMITTRMRDTAFKRVLRSIALPAEVKIAGPYGKFTLDNTPADAPVRPAVFLTGGIGITPFFSISVQAARDRLPQQLYLFYSNRRPEDAAFLGTLSGLAAQNPNFHFIPTMTGMEKSKMDWKGERGVISREMLERHLPGLKPGNRENAQHGSKEPFFHQPIYYIAGPPAMVATMRQMLTGAGANENDIRTEEFSGY